MGTFCVHLYRKEPSKESRKYGARDAEETPLLLHHKLDRWYGHRLRLALLPDAGLRRVGATDQGPQELMCMTRGGADHLAIDEPVNPYGRYIFGQGKGK